MPAFQISLIIAAPVLLGALGRIPLGAMTDPASPLLVPQFFPTMTHFGPAGGADAGSGQPAGLGHVSGCVRTRRGHGRGLVVAAWMLYRQLDRETD